MKSVRSFSFVLVLGLLAALPGVAAAIEDAEVEALIEQLEGDDLQAQIEAANELAHEAAFARPAVPALIAALSSDEPQVRLSAARTLGALSSAAEDAVPKLVELLGNDPEPSVRAISAWSLGQIGVGGDVSGPALIRAVTDEDPMVRRTVLTTLRHLDVDREAMKDVWVEVLTDSDPAVIMPALHSLADMGAEAVPALTTALNEPGTAYWACLVLAEIGADAEPAADELAEVAANSEQHQTRMQALLAIAEIGPGAEEELELITPLLDDDLEAVQYAAVYAVGRIGVGTDEIDAKLQAMLEHEDEFLQMMSAWALAVLNPGEEDMAQLAVDRLMAGMQSENRDVRSAAVTALVQGNFPSEIVRPALLDSLDDIDPQVLAIGMQAIVAQGEEAVPRLVASLEIDELRPMAVEGLRRLGPLSAPAVPSLIELLENSDEQLVGEVQFALASIGPEAAGAVPALTAQLASESPLLRNSACYALGQIGEADYDAQVALVQLIKNAESPEEKLPAVWALLKMRPDSDRLREFAVPLLMRGLESDGELIRIQCAIALGELGDTAEPAVEDLQEALFDRSPQVREAAAEALEAIGS